MTTASAICDALAAAGVLIVFEAGKPHLRGKAPPADLLAAVQAHKPAVLAEWERRELLDRQRYGRVPAAEIPLRAHVLGQAEGMSAAGMLRIRRALDHAAAQGPDVCAWVERRSCAYFDRAQAARGHPASPQQCDLTACVDLLCWQARMEWGDALLDRLEAFAESAATFPKETRIAPINTDSKRT